MGGSKAPMAYQPTHSAAVDNAYAANIDMNTQNTSNLYGYSKPRYEGLVDSAFHNPGDAIATRGAYDVSQAGSAAGHNMLDRGYQMAGLAPGAIQSGWDPQSANYNWGLGQTMGATEVANAQSGVNGSPFGSGVVGDAAASYNRGWQADTQARQGQGIAQLGAINSGANDSMGQGLSTMTSSALLPQAAANDQNNQKFAALDELVKALSSITGTSQNNAATMNNYLNTSTNASKANADITQANNATSQAMWSALGQVAGLGASFIHRPH